MPGQYLVLLRGINVGGKNALPMRSLVEIVARTGATQIRTYIQSGNVLLTTAHPESLAEQITAGIAADFNLKVPVVVRSREQLEAALAANPFLNAGEDPALLHGMFLRDRPTAAQLASLDPQRSLPDRFAVVGDMVYLHLPNGVARTKLTNAYFDQRLATIGTQRNWKTIESLARMMAT